MIKLQKSKKNFLVFIYNYFWLFSLKNEKLNINNLKLQNIKAKKKEHREVIRTGNSTHKQSLLTVWKTAQ
mgnify:CR=1 FL=1